MIRRPMGLVSVLAAMGMFAVAGCGEGQGDVSSATEAVLGDALPGTVAADFADATDDFAQFESSADGVGPIFNAQSCGQCHTNGALGGAGEQIERREGRFVNGAFDPLAGNGGSLRQLFTLGNFNNPDLPAGSRGRCNPNNPTLCCVPLEVEPPTATVHNVGRLTTPLFGLGLVDAMPDSFFDGLVAAEPAAVRGTVNRAQNLLPNPDDPSQSIGSTRVARFGWKAGVPNLTQFAADAYINEMGITTQHCIRGTSVTAFAIESAPNGTPVRDGCDDLNPRNSTADAAAIGLPGVAGQQVDRIVGSCAGGLTELNSDVQNFAFFMTHLGVPGRGPTSDPAVGRGQPLFTSVGCAGCHVSTTFRTPSNPANGVPGNFAFNPFSDFAVHDMGTLGDQIGNAGESLARTRQMRTAPLWGIRFRNHLLHDGRASDIATAIRAHDGQGAAARNAFNALNGTDQHNLTEFVRSL